MKILKTLQLTNNWVILVITSAEDVVNEIDRLSGGIFKPDIKKWLDSQLLVKWDYNARKRFYTVRDQYIAQARINVGEQDLDNPSTYSPTPLKVGRNLVGIDENKTTGLQLTEYVHYCYLQVPDGTTEITVKGQTVQINLNDNQISRAIKVNQAGYLPDAPSKYAYIGAHIYGVGPLVVNATTFEIINEATNQVVYTGDITLRDANKILSTGIPVTGENVYEMNFSDFKDIGNFFIRVPGVGKSWSFNHSEDAYGEVFYTATRGLYHQRCGIELKKPFTNWPRIKCHTKPICESKFVSFPAEFLDRPKPYERFDIYGATTVPATTTTPAYGGWHDAADWDRNTQHYICVFDLLYAYELDPEKFKSKQLNIPNSINNILTIPDILIEAEYGLVVWRNSMNSVGGISGMIETSTHPTIDVDGKYAYSIRTRWDSLLFAAAAAMYAQLVKPFSAKASSTWEYYATKAYQFGTNPKNSLGTIKIPARTDRGVGEYYEYTFTETDAHTIPLLAHAKARLHKLTGKVDYLKDLDAIIPTMKAPFKHPYNNKDYSCWINYSLLDYVPIESKALYIKRWFYDYANIIVSNLNSMPYRCTWPVVKDYYMAWGATNMCNENKALLVSYILSDNIKYKEAAILNFDYMLGVNPMGMVWTTGIGKVYPIVLQHDVSLKDGIVDPVPGITLYGITGGMYNELRTRVWQSPSPTGQVNFQTHKTPLWRTWSPHPYTNTGQCEFTIQETMSSTIFSAAMLLSDNWMPSTELKEKMPTPVENLHGMYYLP